MDKPDSLPPLFLHYPELMGRLNRLPLGSFPTPLQKLDHLGVENLWIKRDDLTSSLYGGNKIRKLAFSLADAKRQGKRRVVTFGGIGTNHGLATAIFCRQLNLACTLLLFRQPVTRHVKQNLRLFCHYGAQVIYKRSLWNTVWAYYALQRITSPASYFLFAGGSNASGTIGFVDAFMELAAQINAGQMPMPSVIITPLGTGGTMAGLALGALLAGMQINVIGVRVTASHLGPFPACTPDTVQKLMKAAYRHLKRQGARLPQITIPKPLIDNRYFGPGYGYPTQEGQAAATILKEKTAITLDPCYTAKAFAAVLDHCRQQPDTKGPVLYWHTYNSVDLEPMARQVDATRLPPAIQEMLAKDLEAEWNL